VARAHPDWQFAIVGPVLAGAEGDLAALARIPNVTVEGAIAHRDVPATLARFTVGMIPFRKSPLTAGVNPNKLYEYLAAGLPAVATSFSPDIAAEDGVIALADDAVAFAAACRTLSEARHDAARRARLESRAAAIARAHDWGTIAGEFWTQVAAVVGS
jgi:glycosyltransferase involved in cell wall biosynthesis